MGLFDFFSKWFVKKGDKPNFRKPPSSAKVCYLTNDLSVIRNRNDLADLAKKIPGSKLSGLLLDLKGSILDGKKLKGDGGQNENQDPLLRIYIPGVTIYNGFCRNVKDGIRADAENITFKRLTFLDVGEDAISNSRNAPGTQVIDCEFDNSKRSSADKSIQLNNGKNAFVNNCTIYGGITAIRMGDTWNSSNDTGTIKNTKFVNVETAMNFAKIKVKLSNNSFTGVRKQIVHSHGSKVI